jgi:hypothetical protein
MLLSLVLGANNSASPKQTKDRGPVTGLPTTQQAGGVRLSPVSRPPSSVDAITIPGLLNYQGKLLDASGNPVPDTTYSVQFALYVVPTGGSSFWSETQTVRTKAGLFSALLGSVTPIESVPQAGACYLSMKVGADPEMTPRIQIASAAYAFLTQRADSATHAGSASVADSARIALSSYSSANLQGKDTTAFVRTGQANSITSGMIVAGTITSADVAANFKAPYADTSDYARMMPGEVDSARIAAAAWNAYKLEGKDTTGLDARYVRQGQNAGGDLTGTYPSPTIAAGKVDSVRLAAAAVTMSKLNQAGAATGQVIKWTGSAWAPRNDSVGVSDNAWTRAGSDSVLYTVHELGLARGSAGNKLYGTSAYTHVNFGVNCTTGVSGVNNTYCTVGGGSQNSARGGSATVAGGSSNTASATCATVAGGFGNGAAGNWSTASGGFEDTASGTSATVGGGEENKAGGGYATVGGGMNNSAAANRSTVAGGSADSSKSAYCGVLAGEGNVAGDLAKDSSATVAGGQFNHACSTWSFVGGGNQNSARGGSATVAGGSSNTASATCAMVGGGFGNGADGNWSTVAGGNSNMALNDYTTVGGGATNTASGYCATVGGGSSDSAGAEHATVGGGYSNTAGGFAATVGGGGSNTANGWEAIVGGGYSNAATGSCATVGGGNSNVADSAYATVAGGDGNHADADYSFAVCDGSQVPASYSNSAAFNGQTATASGQTRVGILSKASGTFTIDDPIDPQNKILNHYFVESPEMVNIYRGVAVLGSDGRAEVQLPAYFDALNQDPMVQLTGVGSSDVFIAEEEAGNRFVIGGKPGMKVYWTATGARKDQSAQITEDLMPVEQPKTGALAGCSLDDDLLLGTMAQLQAMGLGTKYQFRTAAARQRYEDMLKQLGAAEQHKNSQSAQPHIQRKKGEE